MPQSIKARKPQIYLLSEVSVSALPKDENALRTFSGVANSGRPFNYYGELAIVDLSALTYKDNIPALLEHERGQRVGFGALSVVDNQLLINGTLLNNQHGNEIADDADAGFPWQMSAHVTPSYVDEIREGESAEVNGQTVTAPMLILRESKISEISFTPTGVDSETSAVVLADDGTYQSTAQPTPNPTNETEKDTDMTLAEALQAIEQQKAQLAERDKTIKELQETNDELTEAAKKAEDAANEAMVDAQLSQAGFIKNESGEGFNGISAGTRSMLLSAKPEDAKAMIGDLRAPTRDDVPEFLLSEQHKGGGGGQQQQSQANPMLANAAARAKDQKSYI